MTYRDDLTALAARHDALASEVAQKTRELEDSRRLLEQAKARAKLPVLDNIRVASPCTADWNQMTGDDRTRHCGECNKNVYNLSGMTRDEAEALLIERNGELCVRYFQRHDGTILLADCTVGVKRRRRRRWIAAGAVAMLAGGVSAAGAVQHAARSEMGRLEIPIPPSGWGRLVTESIEVTLPPPPPTSSPGPDDHFVMGAIALPELPTTMDPAPAHPRAQPDHQTPRTPKRDPR